jgi:hypothetical protein
LRIGGEYKAVAGGKNLRRPRTFALDDLIITEANVVLLQLLAEYYIIKIG